MPGPLRLTGTAASPGYAEGPIVQLAPSSVDYRRKGSAGEEKKALLNAISAASEKLADMMSSSSGDAADMLEFQLAMLSDDEMSGPALAAIQAGVPADAAWSEALDAEIAGYEASGDEYFRARSADLKDIRQQVLDVLTAADRADMPAGAILYGDDIGPTRFLSTDWSRGGGIALTKGSSASHVAMLARARGVPMVVGLPSATDLTGIALLDAVHGGIVLNPGAAEIEGFRQASQAYGDRQRLAEESMARPATTANGVRVRTMVNIADPSDVERVDVSTCDGVGLMRTEFLFRHTLPDEETQYRAYRKVLEWAAGKPVTIRTVDAGGDKPVPGLTIEEANPFLGLRGIRLSLARPEIFRVQIRALLRAAVHGNLKVMFPMIAVPEEYARASALFGEEAAALSAAGIDSGMPPLGIMVEVPSVAIAPEGFADVAFFSIGSNDLTQYVMAAARDNTTVAVLNKVTNPAVLRLIAAVVAFGRERGIPVSLCGDAGGDPAAIPALLDAGLRDLSVAPAQLALAKAAIAGGPGLTMARATQPAPQHAESVIGGYKSVLSAVIEQRPSGTRQRLADALGKHRSFVTQITSPAYATPIPAKHLAVIFSVCHFSAQERTEFLRHYRAAHPEKHAPAGEPRSTRTISLTVPDLGDAKRNAALDSAVGEFILKITSIAGRSQAPSGRDA